MEEQLEIELDAETTLTKEGHSKQHYVAPIFELLNTNQETEGGADVIHETLGGTGYFAS